jgi:hypothetical protein
MQLLNWATARGEKCSENVAGFSDKSILSLRGHSDIVAYEFCPTVSLASNLVTRAGAYLLLALFRPCAMPDLIPEYAPRWTPANAPLNLWGSRPGLRPQQSLGVDAVDMPHERRMDRIADQFAGTLG